MSHFFFGITSTDLKKKLFFFLKRWLTRGKRFLKKGEKRLINGERSMVKIGGIRTVWLGGEILKKKKNGKNVKMLHVGVFLNSKNENQYSGFP